MAVVNNVYPYRMPSGVPGAVNREWEHTGEPNQISGTLVPAFFGDPVKLTGGLIQALAAGDLSAAIYGFLERSFPGGPGTSYGPSTQLLGAVSPAANARCTILKRGYMTVLVQGATAAVKGAPVYVRLAGTVPTGGRLGGLEAAADTSGSTAVSAAKVGNTGNGTMALDATTPVQPNAVNGVYTVTYTSATAFVVNDPAGRVLGNGVNGTAFTDQIKFVNTAGGTAFVAGDAFNVTVALGANTILVPGAYWMGAADSSGNAEIAYNL